jgi:hypothetical protein
LEFIITNGRHNIQLFGIVSSILLILAISATFPISDAQSSMAPVKSDIQISQRFPYVKVINDDWIYFNHTFCMNGTVKMSFFLTSLDLSFMPSFPYNLSLSRNDSTIQMSYVGISNQLDFYYRFGQTPNGSKITIVGNLSAPGSLTLRFYNRSYAIIENSILKSGFDWAVGFDFRIANVSNRFNNENITFTVPKQFMIDPYTIATYSADATQYATERKAFFDNSSSVRWCVLPQSTGLYFYNSSDGMNWTQNIRITDTPSTSSKFSLRWRLNSSWFCYVVWINITGNYCAWFNRVSISGNTATLGTTYLIENTTSTPSSVQCDLIDIDIASPCGMLHVVWNLKSTTGQDRIRYARNPHNDGSAIASDWIKTSLSLTTTSGRFGSSINQLSNNGMYLVYKNELLSDVRGLFWNNVALAWQAISGSYDTIFPNIPCLFPTACSYQNLTYITASGQGGVSPDNYLHMRFYNATSRSLTNWMNETSLALENGYSPITVNITSGDCWIFAKTYPSAENASFSGNIYKYFFSYSNQSFNWIQWFVETGTTPTSKTFNPWCFCGSDSMISLTYSIPYGIGGSEVRYYEENLTIVAVVRSWHDVATWTYQLITRQWIIVGSWTFNITSGSWYDVAIWLFTLTTPIWKDITLWTFDLTPVSVAYLILPFFLFALIGFVFLIAYRKKSD